MVADITIAEASKHSVQSWSIVDGQLRLRLGGIDEERALTCDNCGRRHWVLETRTQSNGGVLAVRCHNCGTSQEFVLRESEVLPR